MTKNNTGVLGIEYEEVDLVANKSNDDWMTLIKGDSEGLTKTGQKLFQLAVESYVYSMLGAQAQTRWPIVRQGAKSLQTQDIFHRLVKDTITPRRSRESHLGHEVGDKEHKRGFEPRYLTGFDTDPLRHDHPEEKGHGV